eukprot:3435031-Pyramimonas_sp.AAC.1
MGKPHTYSLSEVVQSGLALGTRGDLLILNQKKQANKKLVKMKMMKWLEKLILRTLPLKAASPATLAMRALRVMQMLRSAPIALSREMWICLLGGKQEIPIKNMALRKPDGVDLNPDRGPARCAPGAPAGAAAKAAPKSKPETVDLPPSSASSSPSLGPDQLKPEKTERGGPGDPNPGGSKQQRYAGQPVGRQRSRGPAVAAAAARFQGT